MGPSQAPLAMGLFSFLLCMLTNYLVICLIGSFLYLMDTSPSSIKVPVWFRLGLPVECDLVPLLALDVVGLIFPLFVQVPFIVHHL